MLDPGICIYCFSSRSLLLPPFLAGHRVCPGVEHLALKSQTQALRQLCVTWPAGPSHPQSCGGARGGGRGGSCPDLLQLLHLDTAERVGSSSPVSVARFLFLPSF